METKEAKKKVHGQNLIFTSHTNKTETSFTLYLRCRGSFEKWHKGISNIWKNLTTKLAISNMKQF